MTQKQRLVVTQRSQKYRVRFLVTTQPEERVEHLLSLGACADLSVALKLVRVAGRPYWVTVGRSCTQLGLMRPLHYLVGITALWPLLGLIQIHWRKTLHTLMTQALL